MYRDIATAVYKRGVDNVSARELPSWAFFVFFLDLLVFLPMFVVLGYTLNNVYPVLAMIEDPSPPAYEPVSLNGDDDNESLAEDAAPLADEAARGGSERYGQTRAVTSSFRSIHRTLWNIAGLKSYFRGLACWIALTVSTLFVFAIVSTIPFVPSIFAAMISAMALVQLYTAWLHIVISAPSTKHFWQRLPTFKKAFQATALPTVLYFVALEIQQTVPRFIARAMGMSVWDSTTPDVIPKPQASDSWKALLVFIISISLTIFLAIPAHVVLTRVQASLLPEEDETIVPFDRSFQGKMEPAIVGGRGFVTVMDAWKTFSRASWIRLVKLYLKIFLAGLAVSAVCVLVLAPEMFIIMRHSQKSE
ncbi:uncharacterized protein BCR38DRAFT_409894 [Pseudomassariella vexata]|uniref:Ubiquitin carrier protein n=1 Tax=Pseudomassariella vexata TaxID=1141098 RepID=A0A1Y2DWA5_9PEZI|nr:uncharacterized protein BCR38DRAFT_409894 [Pseudomassariella vexata]ORY62905.1 hypothetical protein BCR38DRAFT_409894 [Pseudomassariella vexata]